MSICCLNFKVYGKIMIRKSLLMIFIVFFVFDLSAGALSEESRRVENWIKLQYPSDSASFRMQNARFQRIMQSTDNETKKIENLRCQFKQAFISSKNLELQIALTQGIHFSADNKTLLKCPENITSVIIPSCVTSIGERAFYGCSKLTSITIPNSVTSIKDGAFYECRNLTNITIPNSVTTIGDEAFYKCSKLTSITIPNSVTSIGKSAFEMCKNLTNITIPNSVTIIKESTFAYCENLTNVTIPNSVMVIKDYAFEYSRVYNVVIPARCQIGKEAFPRGCRIIRK